MRCKPEYMHGRHDRSDMILEIEIPDLRCFLSYFFLSALHLMRIKNCQRTIPPLTDSGKQGIIQNTEDGAYHGLADREEPSL